MSAVRTLSISSEGVPPGSIAPLIHTSAPLWPGLAAYRTSDLPLPDCGREWRAGTLLGESPDTPLFMVTGRILLPRGLPQCDGRNHAESGAGANRAWSCPLLQSLAPLSPDQPARPVQVGALAPHSPAACAPGGKRRWSLAWITLSDKGAAGLRADESGPLMASLVREKIPLSLERGFLLPDEPHALRALVMELALGQGFDLILTSGGTGLSPRDTTPEALLPLFDRRLPGFERAMTAASLAKTPAAALSRGVAGTLDRSIVLTLPGSKKAVAENLEAVLPAMGHALDKLHGDPADCGA